MERQQKNDLVYLMREKLTHMRKLRESNRKILLSKIDNGDFDVFLCYNTDDKSDVKNISKRLKQNSIYPWLDEEQLRPGVPWQRELEKQINKIKTVAVFVGESGIGPWQTMELEAFLREFVKRGCPIIPVILMSAYNIPEIPPFLNGNIWVDFRKFDPDPLEQLYWGITGEKAQVFL